MSKIGRKPIDISGIQIEIKGQEHLIIAMKNIVKTRKDVLCLIGGSGPLKKKLQKQINHLDLQDFVKIIGFVPDNILPIYMNACDVFVLPSMKESFGIVQIEAMACGKPIVATYNGGSEEIITSEDYGLLCKPANSDELTDNILISLDKKWDKGEIIKYADQFTWQKITDKIIILYNKILYLK